MSPYPQRYRTPGGKPRISGAGGDHVEPPGRLVARADMKPGDLVFFHTSGRYRHVSHVGIYISNGRFIHAPTYGKRVQISSLDEAYWAKRFVGAKRPEGMLALIASNNG